MIVADGVEKLRLFAGLRSGDGENRFRRLSGRGFEGYVQQVRLWGVYPGEKVE